MSRPIHVEESVTVARSPEAVWSVVADYGTDTEWRKGLTDMTPDPPGPPAVGTKVHEVLKTGGRSYVADSRQAGGESYRRCRRIAVRGCVHLRDRDHTVRHEPAAATDHRPHGA